MKRLMINSPALILLVLQVVQLLKGENEGVDMKQQKMSGRALILDACDLDEYTSTTYLKDLNRHMELVME